MNGYFTCLTHTLACHDFRGPFSIPKLEDYLNSDNTHENDMCVRNVVEGILA